MPRLGPGERAKIGMSVMAAAPVVDTRSVRSWLDAFSKTHRRYLDAQDAVRAIERKLLSAKRELSGCDRDRNESLETLMRRLMMDGHPRLNPLRGFKVPSPAVLQRQTVATKAATMHRLAESVRQNARSSAATRQAADAIDSAAQVVEQALMAIQQIEADLRHARLVRDAIGRDWDRDLAALRHGAQIAVGAGQPRLLAMLFGGTRRTKRQKRIAY